MPNSIVILEDDVTFSSYIEELIRKAIPDVNMPLVTADPWEIVRYAEQAVAPCVYLLDIVIGKTIAGLTAGQRVFEVSAESKLIYITNYPKYIVTNPFHKIRAYSIIIKSSEGYEQELAYTLQEGIKAISEDNLIVYDCRECFISITVDGIFYIETLKGSKKARIHHERGVFQVNMTMNSIMSKLDKDFVRCHNSYIVNPRKIERLDKVTRTVYLKRGNSCNYSYAKGQRLMEKMKELYQ